MDKIKLSVLGFLDSKDIVKDIQPYVQEGIICIHIDFFEGSMMYYGISMNQIRKLRKAYPEQILEVHMASYNYMIYWKEFVEIGVDRIIFQVEFVLDSKFNYILQNVKSNNIETGLAINLGSHIEKLDPYISNIDMILVMGAQLGYGEQSLYPEALEKSNELKTKFPNIPICLDGGVRIDNIEKCRDNGIDTFAIGSILTNICPPLISNKLEELEKVLK